MKKIFLSLLVTLVLVSCTTSEKGSMLVSGEIKGLKKGTLYLQKMNDTISVSVDSIVLDGVSVFSLSDDIESPEIYYLTLDNSDDKKIPFFGEEGTITIHTKLDKFRFGADIKGLENQELLEKYNKMIGKFSDKRLDLIKASFEAKKDDDSLKIDSVQSLMNNLVKRRYYYTTNFAITNNNAEVAPYLALTELFDANISLLDTVNNSLTKKVKTSKYGKALEEFIVKIKSQK